MIGKVAVQKVNKMRKIYVDDTDIEILDFLSKHANEWTTVYGMPKTIRVGDTAIRKHLKRLSDIKLIKIRDRRDEARRDQTKSYAILDRLWRKKVEAI